jgi:hypothetical protein
MACAAHLLRHRPHHEPLPLRLGRVRFVPGLPGRVSATGRICQAGYQLNVFVYDSWASLAWPLVLGWK